MVQDWMGYMDDDHYSSPAVVAVANHFYQTALVRINLLSKVIFRVRYFVTDTTVLRSMTMGDILGGLYRREPASQFNYHLKQVFSSQIRPALQRCP